MSDSKKHHFIPVFYLKQFTNSDGSFFIYDVKKKAFKNKGGRFFPNSHFYEYQSNTTFYNDQTSDFIENSFCNWDNKVASIYKKIINKQGSEIDLSAEEWTLLQYFVNIMHWRNPSNTDMVKDYIAKAKSISDFRLKLYDKKDNTRIVGDEEHQFLEKLKADPEFFKFLRAMLPAITYPEVFSKNQKDFAHIISNPTGLPKLVSDNPIIYRKQEGKTLHTDDFVFLLSGDKILFRNTLDAITFYPDLRMLIDMMLIMQAKAYFACTDLGYPQMLIKFMDNFSSVEELRGYIFKNIHHRQPGAVYPRVF